MPLAQNGPQYIYRQYNFSFSNNCQSYKQSLIIIAQFRKWFYLSWIYLIFLPVDDLIKKIIASARFVMNRSHLKENSRKNFCLFKDWKNLYDWISLKHFQNSIWNSRWKCRIDIPLDELQKLVKQKWLWNDIAFTRNRISFITDKIHANSQEKGYRTIRFSEQ